jgi:hypothetical protein
MNPQPPRGSRGRTIEGHERELRCGGPENRAWGPTAYFAAGAARCLADRRRAKRDRATPDPRLPLPQSLVCSLAASAFPRRCYLGGSAFGVLVPRLGSTCSAPAAGVRMLSWPSSQWMRKRGGSLRRISSITPCRGALRRPLGLDYHAVTDLRAHYSSLQMSTICASVSSSRPAVWSRTDCSCEPTSSTTEACSATRESTRTRSRLAPPNGGTAPSSNSG